MYQIDWVPAIQDLGNDAGSDVSTQSTDNQVEDLESEGHSVAPAGCWKQAVIDAINARELDSLLFQQLKSICTDDWWEVEKVLTDTFSSRSHSDCTIVTGSGRHKTHRLVLMTHSEYFRAVLSGRWSTEESSEDGSEITLSDCDDEHLKSVLEYFYTGRTSQLLQESSILPCLLLSHMLMAKDVTELLSDHLITTVTKQNACEMYVVADRLAISQVKERAVHLLIKHYHELFAPDTASIMDIQQQLSASEIKYLEILNGFYRRAQDRGIIIDSSISRISEALAITYEALRETRERYVEARAQSDRDIAECEAALDKARDESDRFTVGGVVLNFWQRRAVQSVTSLTARLERLSKVRSALNRQEHHIEMQQAFYERQKTAFESLTELSRAELKLKQQQHQQQGLSSDHSESMDDGDYDKYLDLFDLSG